MNRSRSSEEPESAPRSTRRDFLKLAGLGTAVFVSSFALDGLGADEPRAGSRAGHVTRPAAGGFTFVQLSDTHWGFEGPTVNPDPQGTLPKAIEAVNGLDEAPDFVVFTGDLTHTTDDARVRRERMARFRDVASRLKTKHIRYLAGEHDASLDEGEEFQRQFGALHGSFDHKGVHFVVLDNVSDASARVGAKQLRWLRADLAKLRHDRPIVVLTHRPLFDLAPDWDWATRDGKEVIDALLPYPNVTVLYGHIHQEHHHATEHIAHHAARGMMFALPAPMSVPKKAPIPWDPSAPYKGLGPREVEAEPAKPAYQLTELSVTRSRA